VPDNRSRFERAEIFIAAISGFVLDVRVKRLFFVTGTDTGVGKTVLTCLLARYWRTKGISVGGFKPLCSGGRDDAKAIHSATGEILTLDEINPWHFSVPVAPLIAARKSGRKVTLPQVAAGAKAIQKKCSVVLIEGAGGLLSPMGEGFDSRDLIQALRATPIVVSSNRLGVVNQIRLVLAALPKKYSERAQIVLMSPEVPDASSRSNVDLLSEFIGSERIHVLPWFKDANHSNPRARHTLETITQKLFL
jgi:dethiobiotin synthetase